MGIKFKNGMLNSPSETDALEMSNRNAISPPCEMEPLNSNKPDEVDQNRNGKAQNGVEAYERHRHRAGNRKCSIASTNSGAAAELNLVLELNALTGEPEDLPEDKAESLKPVTCTRRYLGILLTLMSSAVFSLNSLIVKVLTERYHPFALGVWRFQGVMIPSVVLILYHKLFIKDSNIFGTIRPLCGPGTRWTVAALFGRSLFGSIAVLLLFCSFSFLSVADATVIAFSSPIVITVLAYFVLREAFSIVQMLMAVVCLIGVGIVARPPFLTGAKEFNQDVLIGTGLALGSMIFGSVVFICLRYLKKTHTLLTTLAFGTWGSFQCLVLSLMLGVFALPQDLTDWGFGLLLGILTFAAQVFMTMALKYEQSGICSIVRCMDVVFAFVYQLIFLGVYPDLYSLVGSLLVLASVAVVGFRKWINELPENDSKRKTFRYIMK